MSKGESIFVNKPLRSALNLAWELGYTIALPLVALAVGGRLLDKYLNTSPLWLLVGVLVSIVVTIWLIYRKVNVVLEQTVAEIEQDKAEAAKLKTDNPETPPDS
ncbi:MAG: AtpZ/AtpI family protein [Patescibacteria group bacterium]